ncbi:methyl-accepting chemotaxis protein [Geobacter sp. FeAm09]|uniref:methyl-accepting chemotaxis protein n=1 Tax=Geobacter sp. FeAm09 TaxID=2597769 RepID=UPI0011EE49FB|nr:HAMP domain-containing methyl-accepting chemotaxis protein [Geobacter sp. FeAm09]QEM67445.1 methyl-accepting chemotaxis protein [Geobacter sp. FeAm09]
MSVWTDMKVKAKIMTLVLASCAALVLVGGFGVVNMSRMNGDEAELKDGMQQTALLQDLKNGFLAMRLDVVYMLALKDAAQIGEKGKDFTLQIENVRKKLTEVEKTDLDAKEKEEIGAFRQGFEAYAVEGTKLADMAKAAHASGDAAAIEAALTFATGKVAPLYAKPAQVVADMVTDNIKGGEDTYRHSSDNFRRIRLVLLAVVALVAAVSLLGGNLIANSVSRPLQAVLDTLREVAGGNLAIRSAIVSKDEMGMLAREVNGTAEKLHGIISMVAGNSAQVASAASELHATAAEMATGAEQMAAQAGTVATASEEMSATSGDIAQNCHHAASGAHQSSQAAESGAGVVENTVQVMGRIASRVMSTAKTVESLGARSDQIGEIVGTIEDIADQTNLLALNAAIEAARAGEQGRGFAVVADEVRALAERTTKATREIGEMIKAIQGETRGAVGAMEEGVREVESGTSEAAKSGAALQSILEQINAVNMQVSQIATAAEEQTATTSEISSNIQQINEVVQHTARGASESVIAANQLSTLAEELQRLVGQFKL